MAPPHCQTKKKQWDTELDTFLLLEIKRKCLLWIPWHDESNEGERRSCEIRIAAANSLTSRYSNTTVQEQDQSCTEWLSELLSMRAESRGPHRATDRLVVFLPLRDTTYARVYATTQSLQTTATGLRLFRAQKSKACKSVGFIYLSYCTVP